VSHHRSQGRRPEDRILQSDVAIASAAAIENFAFFLGEICYQKRQRTKTVPNFRTGIGWDSVGYLNAVDGMNFD
jgi:hypothetical protein